MTDSQFYGTYKQEDLSIEIITPLFENYTEFNEQKCIMHSTENYGRIVVKLPDNSNLESESRIYLQTDKYIKTQMDASAPETRKQILRNRADENRQRKTRLIQALENTLMNAEFYALGQCLDLRAGTFSQAVNEAFDYLVENVYSKFSLLSKLHDDPVKLIKELFLSDDTVKQRLKSEALDMVSNDLREIETFITLKRSKNQPVILDELTSHFYSKPYGWHEWETVLRLCHLFISEKIYFVHEGNRLEQGECASIITKTSQWKNVKLHERITACAEDLKKAQQIGKTLFGSIGPDAQGKLTEFLQKSLLKWQSDLNKYRLMAQTGNYPGLKEINHCLDNLKMLLGIHDPFEFIKEFTRQEEILYERADAINNLNEFYKNQLNTWEELRKSIERFNLNKQIIMKNSDAKNALLRMQEILSATCPYSMLREVAGLIIVVSKVNDKFLLDSRSQALTKIDAYIQQVESYLNEINADNDLRSQSVDYLGQIRKNIESEASIPVISHLLSEAERNLTEVIESIDEKTKPQTKNPPKKIIEIKASAYVRKAYIETEADAEDFTKRLKEGLIKAVENNERVRIK
jgi:hypothetical protein